MLFLMETSENKQKDVRVRTMTYDEQIEKEALESSIRVAEEALEYLREALQHMTEANQLGTMDIFMRRNRTFPNYDAKYSKWKVLEEAHELISRADRTLQSMRSTMYEEYKRTHPKLDLTSDMKNIDIYAGSLLEELVVKKMIKEETKNLEDSIKALEGLISQMKTKYAKYPRF